MEDKYLQIELYLNGELSADELAAFEHLLQTDQAFAEEVSLYKDIEQTMSAEIQRSTRQKTVETTLQSLGDEYFAETEAKAPPQNDVEGQKRPFKMRQLVLGIMSAAAVLLLVFFLLNRVQTLDSPQQIYANYAGIRPWNSLKWGKAKMKYSLLLPMHLTKKTTTMP